MAEKITAPMLRAMKGRGEKIVCVTAYDVSQARLADEAGVDVVLVGDSLGNVVLGYDTTLPVSLETMVHHTRAAKQGVKRALLIADLPFGSYQASVEQAVKSSVELMKAGAEAVKLEGDYVEAITEIRRAGIPVMGHLGFTPQSVNQFGGFRVQGRGDAAAQVMEDAWKLDGAGVFGMVLELIPASLAKQISERVSSPTIGIGAGLGCDGQVQVFHDLFGLNTREFKHAKSYGDAGSLIRDGLMKYAEEVRTQAFPGEENSF